RPAIFVIKAKHYGNQGATQRNISFSPRFCASARKTVPHLKSARLQVQRPAIFVIKAKHYGNQGATDRNISFSPRLCASARNTYFSYRFVEAPSGRRRIATG
ncbi:MAG TPA: hypothetical protein PKW80_09840, partial [Bacteroidales bacterium]|nr:hypothetical protein [Bacteroidales bacterium]